MHVPTATVIDYLDKHSGASTALLTLALVLVTIFYAVQNRRMVGEMAKTRALTILPRLGVEFHHIGPAVMEIAITNVGPGTALNVDIELTFDPADATAPPNTRRYRQNIILSGEQLLFAPPGDLNGNLDTLPQTYRSIRLSGSMTDASGKTHRVDETYDDLSEWRSLLHDAHRSWGPPEPEKRLAQAFAGPLQRLTTELQGISRAVARLARPEADNDVERP